MEYKFCRRHQQALIAGAACAMCLSVGGPSQPEPFDQRPAAHVRHVFEFRGLEYSDPVIPFARGHYVVRDAALVEPESFRVGQHRPYPGDTDLDHEALRSASVASSSTWTGPMSPIRPYRTEPL